MEWWQSIILGLVEGLTEYLPVSSTGHLLLTQRLLGIEQNDAADAYAICIQAGAILAVLGLYWKRVAQMLRGVLGQDAAGLRLAINILVAFLPALIIGGLFESRIKHYLFGDAYGLWPTIIAWFVGGVAILATAWFRRERKTERGAGRLLESLTWKMSLLIGIAQCVAMWPGTSRSLMTIVAGVLVGLSLASAVEFSFLLGVLTLTAATAKDTLSHGSEMLHEYGFATILFGAIAAWLAAVLAVKWMVSYLNRHGLDIFGYYRIALALIVSALVLAGPLRPPAPAPPLADAVDESQVP